MPIFCKKWLGQIPIGSICSAGPEVEGGRQFQANQKEESAMKRHHFLPHHYYFIANLA
jgi:hypothetical protein